MINDILDFSQISKGNLSLNPVNFCIEDMIIDVTKLIKFQAKRKGLDLIIEIKLKNESKHMFTSDPNRIKQVILNLLGNALKFTQKGFLKITIDDLDNDSSATVNKSSVIEYIESLEPLLINEKNKKIKGLKISVTDSGCGIKKEDIPKLFQLFGKLKNEENKKINQTGVGLGLAISQQLVKILNNNKEGGIITVQSEYGQGSIFSFKLYPLRERQNDSSWAVKSYSADIKSVKDETSFLNDESNILFEEAGHIMTLPVVNIKTNHKIFKHQKNMKQVLLVDDDQINILVLTKIFEHFKDCKISFAFHGEQALEIVREKAKKKIFFDIIFMDCNMPVMDGFDATRKILEMVENKEIPKVVIIASTANVSQTDNENCFRSGMMDFISKPFTRQILREKIDLYT